MPDLSALLGGLLSSGNLTLVAIGVGITFLVNYMRKPAVPGPTPTPTPLPPDRPTPLPLPSPLDPAPNPKFPLLDALLRALASIRGQSPGQIEDLPPRVLVQIREEVDGLARLHADRTAALVSMVYSTPPK